MSASATVSAERNTLQIEDVSQSTNIQPFFLCHLDYFFRQMQCNPDFWRPVRPLYPLFDFERSFLGVLVDFLLLAMSGVICFSMFLCGNGVQTNVVYPTSTTPTYYPTTALPTTTMSPSAIYLVTSVYKASLASAIVIITFYCTSFVYIMVYACQWKKLTAFAIQDEEVTNGGSAYIKLTAQQVRAERTISVDLESLALSGYVFSAEAKLTFTFYSRDWIHKHFYAQRNFALLRIIFAVFGLFTLIYSFNTQVIFGLWISAGVILAIDCFYLLICFAKNLGNWCHCS